MHILNPLILFTVLSCGLLSGGIVSVSLAEEQSFTPIESNSYGLSAGDRLGIQVYGEEDLKLEALVGEEGKISYPFLGEIKVKGLTIHELEAYITQGLKGTYLINPEVSVVVLEYRPFYINGEVKNPGGYPYQPSLTLRKAVALAGGLTARGSMDLASVIREKDSSKSSESIAIDSMVNPGDIITIQAHKQVYIDGEVKKPGSYDFQPNLTIQKLVSLAGGFTERARKDKVQIRHEGDLTQEPVEVEPGDSVSPGDIITVRQSFF